MTDMDIAQALRLLPQRFEFPLSELVITPYAPVPETSGEEWDRLEPVSALDALVDLALNGEYHGLDGAKRTKDSLCLRTAAVTVFEVNDIPNSPAGSRWLIRLLELCSPGGDQDCNPAGDVASR